MTDGHAGIYGYDLASPTKLLTAAWAPLRDPPVSDYAAARRVEQERQERLARDLATAEDEWRQYVDRHYANRVARAALYIHQPDAGYDRVVCAECEEHNGYEDTQQVEWPCRTYAAMKEAADG